jgi:predicted lipid-binding transport protein (Tim44 family)
MQSPTYTRPSRHARAHALLRLAVLAAVGLWALAAAPVDARPGGGQTYSSGGGSTSSSGGGSYSSGGGGSYSGNYSNDTPTNSPAPSSSSSSSSGPSAPLTTGGVIALVLVLTFIIGGILLFVLAAMRTPQGAPVARRKAPKRLFPLDLRAILDRDPDFSRVTFEDFAYRLFAAAHRARRDDEQLAKLTPYLAPDVLDALASRAGLVDQVVIGSLAITDAYSNGRPPMVRITVAIEANLASVTGTRNVRESWSFVRSAQARTRPPDQTRTFNCPNCNAPFERGDKPRTCAHCGAAMEVGRFDWTVTRIRVERETDVGPTLTGTVEEVGNDFPTIAQPDARERLADLRKDDANVSWNALSARIHMIYDRLNQAWNAQDLAPVRGLVTASLLEYLQFWIDEYRRQHLANKLERAKIARLTLAKVTRDRWYDAITVRVHADGLDFTIDDQGEVVGGSRKKRRKYTEYWTFVRSSARRGPITATPDCPHCGAPLAISDAGACTHCNVEVENASFDWTLSKIEQDDVYRG